MTTPARAHAWLAIAFLAVAAPGCLRGGISVEPYRSDPIAGDQLRADVAFRCEERRGELPDRAFSSDGCSAFPDASWVDCCVAHDEVYWCGGSADERKRADAELRSCVAEAGQPTLGWFMEKGARMGGTPRLPFSWRWGYGWKEWPRGYDAAPPTADPNATDAAGETGPGSR